MAEAWQTHHKAFSNTSQRISKHVAKLLRKVGKHLAQAWQLLCKGLSKNIFLRIGKHLVKLFQTFYKGWHTFDKGLANILQRMIKKHFSKGWQTFSKAFPNILQRVGKHLIMALQIFCNGLAKMLQCFHNAFGMRTSDVQYS